MRFVLPSRPLLVSLYEQTSANQVIALVSFYSKSNVTVGGILWQWHLVIRISNFLHFIDAVCAIGLNTRITIYCFVID